MTAQAFMQQVLHEQLGAQVLVTGYDNRFGRNRAEGFDDYVRYGKALGMEVLRGDEATFPGTDEAVSSSAIRQLLLEGKVERMQEGLTRPYLLTGKVVTGEHIGHEIGFPTANLAVDNPNKVIPVKEGEMMVDFELFDFDDKPHHLNEFLGKGKYTILEFSSLSCVPCQFKAYA